MQLPALKKRIDQLTDCMVHMQSGPQLIVTHKPGAGIEVNGNSKVQGTLTENDFARELLTIWLGTCG